MNDYALMFRLAHRGPYRPGQACLVIHHPHNRHPIRGQILYVASAAAWHVSRDGDLPWDQESLRWCEGLEVQHVHSRDRVPTVFPVLWMVPIGEDPDATPTDSDRRPRAGMALAG